MSPQAIRLAVQQLEGAEAGAAGAARRSYWTSMLQRDMRASEVLAALLGVCGRGLLGPGERHELALALNVVRPDFCEGRMQPQWSAQLQVWPADVSMFLFDVVHIDCKYLRACNVYRAARSACEGELEAHAL